MRKHEVACACETLAGVTADLVCQINFLLQQGCLFESLEKGFSKFVSESVRELAPCAERGTVRTSRFNAAAAGKGQAAFYVEFIPIFSEQVGVKYVQVVIGEGNYLSREVRFFRKRAEISYVDDEFIPFLENLFSKFGFTILEEDTLFGLLEEKAKKPKR